MTKREEDAFRAFVVWWTAQERADNPPYPWKVVSMQKLEERGFVGRIVKNGMIHSWRLTSGGLSRAVNEGLIPPYVRTTN